MLLLPLHQATLLPLVLLPLVLFPLPLQQLVLLLRVEERLGLLERQSLGLRPALFQVATQSASFDDRTPRALFFLSSACVHLSTFEQYIAGFVF